MVDKVIHWFNLYIMNYGLVITMKTPVDRAYMPRFQFFLIVLWGGAFQTGTKQKVIRTVSLTSSEGVSVRLMDSSHVVKLKVHRLL